MECEDWAYRIHDNYSFKYDGDYRNEEIAINALKYWKKAYPEGQFSIELLDVSIDPDFWAYRISHGEVLKTPAFLKKE